MSKFFNDIITQLPIDQLIGRYYPFNEDELLFLQKRGYIFDEISLNQEINWTPGLIDKVGKNLFWHLFSVNRSVPWKKIASKFESSISWQDISNNPTFVWNDVFLQNHINEIDWYWLSTNNIPFTDENLFRFREFWNWKQLSDNQYISWSEEILDRFAHRWDWAALSYNPNIPFTKELFEKYHDRWIFELMSMNLKLVSNEFLPLLESFTALDYEMISHTKNDFTVKFLEDHEDKLDWSCLSENENLPWSEGILDYFMHRWWFYEMSGNSKVPWSIEFIEKHKDEWNWDGKKFGNNGSPYSLSSNEGLPWSFDFIEKYEHQLEWGNIVVNIDEVYDDLFKGITQIKKIKWTVENIAKYAHHFHDFFFLGNKNFYIAIESEIGKENVFPLYRAIGY